MYNYYISGSCLFDKDEHVWIVEELKILSFILPPLVVPTPFTEKEKKGQLSFTVRINDIHS